MWSVPAPRRQAGAGPCYKAIFAIIAATESCRARFNDVRVAAAPAPGIKVRALGDAGRKSPAGPYPARGPQNRETSSVRPWQWSNCLLSSASRPLSASGSSAGTSCRRGCTWRPSGWPATPTIGCGRRDTLGGRHDLHRARSLGRRAGGLRFRAWPSDGAAAARADHGTRAGLRPRPPGRDLDRGPGFGLRRRAGTHPRPGVYRPGAASRPYGAPGPGQAGSDRPRPATHGLGTEDDPVFPGMHEASAMVAGATLAAARAVWTSAAQHGVSIAGGLHHAMAGNASGFCVYNDPAVAIAWLLSQGAERIAYVDVDAHHGDGVQAAFWDDPRVLTVSLHEHPATLFPGTGYPAETGGPDAEGPRSTWLCPRAPGIPAGCGHL